MRRKGDSILVIDTSQEHEPPVLLKKKVPSVVNLLSGRTSLGRVVPGESCTLFLCCGKLRLRGGSSSISPGKRVS